ncbi:hypothetical protein PENFLA_c040G10731 [Penicillium flavigenum]|uniref:Uncharacterized protein n=1 Tax=Penicillium flavigenum TaxID=254877 RepID=A0A1V6SKR6_9EURO|nr:hypothetical protein PENFLA_c040G10731 [Penicillium flavigenum]
MSSLWKFGNFHTHSWNLFIATEFHFPYVAFTSAQYLQISLSTLEYGKALVANIVEPCFEYMEIVSGVCTFNRGLLLDSISDRRSGKMAVGRLMRAKRTFHDMDYIDRSSTAIADVCTMAILRVQEQRSSRRITSKLDFPSWH